MTDIFWINGEFKKLDHALSPYDSGLVGGIGVFDSLLSIDGELQHAEQHFGRLFHDTQTVIGVYPPLPHGEREKYLINIAHILLQKNALLGTYARVRTVVTGGIISPPLSLAKNLNIFMTAEPCPAPETFAPITCAIILDFPRIAGCILENCKRLDYTRAYAARRRAEKLGAQDAILTNTQGRISCATTSNVFIVEHGCYITPPLSEGCLNGITRQHVICTHHAAEEPITLERLKAADSIFLTNSFWGMRQAHLLDVKAE